MAQTDRKRQQDRESKRRTRRQHPDHHRVACHRCGLDVRARPSGILPRHKTSDGAWCVASFDVIPGMVA